jgi:hypothetical protein
MPILIDVYTDTICNLICLFLILAQGGKINDCEKWLVGGEGSDRKKLGCGQNMLVHPRKWNPVVIQVSNMLIIFKNFYCVIFLFKITSQGPNFQNGSHQKLISNFKVALQLKAAELEILKI